MRRTHTNFTITPVLETTIVSTQNSTSFVRIFSGVLIIQERYPIHWGQVRLPYFLRTESLGLVPGYYL